MIQFIQHIHISDQQFVIVKALPPQIIDFHVHLFPDKLFDAIWHYFSTGYKWDVIYQMYYRDCIDYLRTHNVGKIVYSNYAHRGGIAEGLNSWNLELLDEHPDLYCFAAYHPEDANGPEMAEELFAHSRILGVKLQLLVQRFYPHDRRLFPMYELLIEKNKRLLMHVGTGPEGNEFVGLEHFKTLLESFPELPVNVAHMGALEYQGFDDLLDEYPQLYLDTAFTFYPTMPGAYDLGPEVLERHKERIVYGSDFPNLIFPRETEIEALLAYDLSQEFYDRVFYENGEELLRELGTGILEATTLREDADHREAVRRNREPTNPHPP